VIKAEAFKMETKPFKMRDEDALYTLSGKRIAHEQKGCIQVQKGRKFVKK
jgi:hypothetical protein